MNTNERIEKFLDSMNDKQKTDEEIENEYWAIQKLFGNERPVKK